MAEEEEQGKGLKEVKYPKEFLFEVRRTRSFFLLLQTFSDFPNLSLLWIDQRLLT